MPNSKTVSELVDTARQLSDRDFEDFFEKIQHLHDYKINNKPQKVAAEILKKIKTGLPKQIQLRWNYLIGRRDSDTLTQEEYEELLKLTEIVEKHDTQRLELMTKLAEIQGIPLNKISEYYELSPQ